MERVTTNHILRFTQLQAQKHGAKMGLAQEQITSGIRIQRPSDDPRGTQILLDRRAALQRLNTRISSIQEARSRLGAANQTVRDVQQLIVQAKSLALSGRQASDSGEIRTIADEVDGLLKKLIQLANTEQEGEPLFAGASRAQAFSVNGTQVTYQGSDLAGSFLLAGTGAVKVNYSGQDVFFGASRGDTLVIGNTGVLAGAGTSSARGTRELIVTHTATTFSGASGIQAGTSTGADTILGPVGVHTLTINDTSGTGASGTISLNGGEAVAFTSSDADLVVTGPNGEVVHVNATAITAGFNGTIDVSATGALSIDGGATQTIIDFTANQGVIDSRDGSVVYLDTRSIDRTGTDHLEFVGTGDVFQVLAQLRDELRNIADLPVGERDQLLANRIDDLDRLGDHLLSVVGEQSITLQYLDGLEDRTSEQVLATRETLSQTESTDYVTAVLDMQNAEMMLQYALATAARLFNISVLNFMN